MVSASTELKTAAGTCI